MNPNFLINIFVGLLSQKSTLFFSISIYNPQFILLGHATIFEKAVRFLYLYAAITDAIFFYLRAVHFVQTQQPPG